MSISLSPSTQRLLEQELQTGPYRSADELVCAALHALREPPLEPLDEATLDALDQAEDEIERGEVYAWEDVRERLRARFQGKK